MKHISGPNLVAREFDKSKERKIIFDVVGYMC